MRVVSNDPKLVVMSEIEGGGAFRWNGMYFIRPCKRIRDDHNIGGINLENGTWVTDSTTTFVVRALMEAREL